MLMRLSSSFDGKTIHRFDGTSVILKLKGEGIRTVAMSLRQRVLAKALNPNIALMLGLIGLMGLYIEFTHPGLILPGVVGGLCLFIALVALNILPVNATWSCFHHCGRCSLRVWRQKSLVTARLLLSELRQWFSGR